MNQALKFKLKSQELVEDPIKLEIYHLAHIKNNNNNQALFQGLNMSKH